jgi:membrane associated rhomboid family serine protease
MISITLAITILTSIVSFTAFSNQKISNDLIFHPPSVKNRNQWYRFLSCALIHANMMHLIFNMITFYSFGTMVERSFAIIFPGMGSVLFIALYVISQIACLVPTYIKHQNDYNYRSLGASGAVSGVVFAGILISPLDKLYLMFIPIGIPAFIFGILFLGISFYFDKKGGGGNFNHSAHYWGALAGVVLMIIFSYTFSGFDAIGNFVFLVRGFAGF